MVNAQWQYLLNDTALSDINAVQVVLWHQGLCAFGYDSTGKVLIIEYRRSEKELDDIALENIILSLPLLAGPQQVRSIRIAETRNIVIPDNLFTEKDAAEWLNRLHFVEQDEIILKGNIPQSADVLVYPLSVHRQHLLQQYFPEASIAPLTAIPATDRQESHAQVTIISNLALLCVTAGPQLLIHQWYPYETAEDIVYKIALVQDTHKLTREDMHITLSGMDSDLVSLSNQIQAYYGRTELVTDNEAAAIDFLTKLASCAS